MRICVLLDARGLPFNGRKKAEAHFCDYVGDESDGKMICCAGSLAPCLKSSSAGSSISASACSTVPCSHASQPPFSSGTTVRLSCMSGARFGSSYPHELAQVCNLTTLPAQDLDDVLAATLVEEVWGVGRRIAAQLHEGGIHTVLDLARMEPATIRRRWSVVLERTVRELQGMQCIDLDNAPAPKKEIACTRSFGQAITELPPLVEAVSEFASRAAEKLRKQGSLASQLLVFAHTSPFRPGPRFNKSVVVPLRRPTADTGKLVWAAAMGMRRMYEPGYKMAKAGVMLLDLVPGSVLQGELDLEEEDQRDRTKLMVALDTLNGRYGKGTVHSASTGGTNEGKDWGMKQERRTPQYTTRWEDVPVARA